MKHLFLVGLISLLVLTACGGGGSSSGSPTVVPAVVTTSTPSITTSDPGVITTPSPFPQATATAGSVSQPVTATTSSPNPAALVTPIPFATAPPAPSSYPVASTLSKLLQSSNSYDLRGTGNFGTSYDLKLAFSSQPSSSLNGQQLLASNVNIAFTQGTSVTNFSEVIQYTNDSNGLKLVTVGGNANAYTSTSADFSNSQQLNTTGRLGSFGIVNGLAWFWRTDFIKSLGTTYPTLELGSFSNALPNLEELYLYLSYVYDQNSGAYELRPVQFTFFETGYLTAVYQK